MCGIAGVWDPTGAPAPKHWIPRMLGQMAHRGPEGAGCATVDGGALQLGFLALAFTDTPTNLQPLFDETGQVALVYNGEIYDYEALRADLVARGHRFRTKSDSEVVLHLYTEYGRAFTDHLNGEFAFVIWDGHTRELLCVRDRFGIKPLYWAEHDGRFVFASEAKALLALDRFERRLAPDWFAGPGLGIAETSLSIFDGIRQVRPGTLFSVTPRRRQQTTWWRPCDVPAFEGTYDEAKGALRTALERAVERRIGGDVPIALALSSGLDSSLIAALATRIRHDRTAFALTYPGRSFDEGSQAERTARYLGLDYHPVTCTSESLARDFLFSLWVTEVPTNSLSTAGRIAMTRAVRSAGLKALAGGEASDEVFGGYPYFGVEALWRALDAGTPGAHEALARFRSEEGLSRGVFWDDGDDWRTVPPLFGAPSAYHLRARKTMKLQRFVLSRGLRGRLAGRGPMDAVHSEFDVPWMRTLSPFDRTRVVARSILSTFGMPALGDRVEMANSLEGRVPFLDRDVLNLAYSFPEAWCVQPGTFRRKSILRDVAHGLLPPDFRPLPKHTHMAPSFREMLQSPTGQSFRDLLRSRVTREVGVFDVGFVRALRVASRVWPQSDPRFASLDGLLGYVLSVHALHHACIARPQTFRRPAIQPVDTLPADLA